MYHFGFLIKCSFKGWESFWTVSLPRNSWAGPPRCSGRAGPRQNCHGFFWTPSKPRWTEGDPDQDPVAVLWLTPKHSHFECHSSHALVLMEICLNNIMLLQPFWGLIQSPLRWDNAHWFQWAVNYTFYFRLKSSFFFLFFPFFIARIKICVFTQITNSADSAHPSIGSRLFWKAVPTARRSGRPASQSSSLLLHCFINKTWHFTFQL